MLIYNKVKPNKRNHKEINPRNALKNYGRWFCKTSARSFSVNCRTNFLTLFKIFQNVKLEKMNFRAALYEIRYKVFFF